MTFETVASSSSGNCYIVRAPGRKPLLIEAGIKFKEIQKAANFALSGFEACLVSHAHGDHAKSLDQVLSAGVTVFASPETCAGRKHHRLRPIESYAWFTTPGVHPYEVLPVVAVHDCPGTMAFLVRAGKESLLYLTDSSYSLNKFTNVTILAVECNHSEELLKENAQKGNIETDRFRRTMHGHMSLERLLKFLHSCDLSATKEIHLLHLSDPNSDEAAFKLKVQSEFGIPVYIAPKKAIQS